MPNFLQTINTIRVLLHNSNLTNASQRHWYGISFMLPCFSKSLQNWTATSGNVPSDIFTIENSDQPARLRSLIRIFTRCILDSQWRKVSSCGQRRVWSDCANPSLSLTNITVGTFLDIAVQLGCVNHVRISDYSTLNLTKSNQVEIIDILVK